MTAVIWFVFGTFVGFDIAVAYAWLTVRRANHDTRPRVLRFDTPAARNAIHNTRKPS